jgi:hypothetical protein
MDVIAGRKTLGRISGNITVDGHPLASTSFSRISGYVSTAILWCRPAHMRVSVSGLPIYISKNTQLLSTRIMYLLVRLTHPR